jgi:hypothetical protein
VIIEGKLENQTSIVELGKLAEGNYFITIGDKEKQVFKIVKN